MTTENLDNLQLNAKIVDWYQNAPNLMVGKNKAIPFKSAMISVIGDSKRIDNQQVAHDVHFEYSQQNRNSPLENAQLVLRGAEHKGLPNLVPVADLNEATVMTLIEGEVDRYFDTFNSETGSFETEAFRGVFGLTTSLANYGKKPSLEMLKFLVQQMGRKDTLDQTLLDEIHEERRHYNNLFGGIEIYAKAAGYQQAYDVAKHLKAERGDDSPIGTHDLCDTIDQAIAARDHKIQAELNQAIQDPSWEM